MITEYFKKNDWHGQRITARTELAGREYYWMLDIDGTHYLAKIDDNGNPDLS